MLLSFHQLQRAIPRYAPGKPVWSVDPTIPAPDALRLISAQPISSGIGSTFANRILSASRETPLRKVKEQIRFA